MPKNDRDTIAEFIREKGITRCPTACVLPTQASILAADRIALEQHAVARDRIHREQAAARWGNSPPSSFRRRLLFWRSRIRVCPASSFTEQDLAERSEPFVASPEPLALSAAESAPVGMGEAAHHRHRYRRGAGIGQA